MVNNVYRCPECGSNDVDHATVGLPDAMQCLDCGYLYPQILSLFPKVVKTENKLPKGAKGSSPNAWPFPTSLRPKKLNDQLPNTRDSGNTQEAPF